MEPLRQPVVLVDIDGDSVTLNGALIERVDDADAWIVALQAVCSTVAAPLGRPVWAVISEPGGQTRLAVHPDASISRVEQVDPPPALPIEPLALALVAPMVPEATAPDIPVPAHDELAAFLAQSARAEWQSPRPARVEHTHRGPGRPHPAVRRTAPLLGVAALVTLVLAASLLVTRGDDEPPTANEPTTQAADAKDVLPSAQRAQLRDRFPRDLDVHVVPHGASVEIRVEASQLPVRAVIVLNPANGSRVERRVTLRTAVTQLRMDTVPAGSVDWSVQVTGAQTATGSVEIPEAPTEAPTTTATETPSSTSPEPTETAPSEPLTPIDPDLPTGPIDPDDL